MFGRKSVFIDQRSKQATGRPKSNFMSLEESLKNEFQKNLKCPDR